MGTFFSYPDAVRFYNAVLDYNEYSSREEIRQSFLQFLQNNDCRELIAKCVDGDNISNAFALTGWRNHPDILQAFLDRGMNIDIKNQYGWTALIAASSHGLEESVRLLLNHNANVDIQGDYGWTALMRASYFSRKEIVQLLLDHNAGITLKDKNGKTALDLARNKEIKEMIQNHVNTSYILK